MSVKLKTTEKTADWQMIASSSRSSTRPSGGLSQGRFLSHDDVDGALKAGLIYTRLAQIDGRNTRLFTAGWPLYYIATRNGTSASRHQKRDEAHYAFKSDVVSSKFLWLYSMRSAVSHPSRMKAVG
ncbi:hypothetical protein NUW54_g7311 [Trametes sanguinea]|uniref:Uncharacterized protein n=1 Tax=Trametes sanguinea TaxID=158606 RepID=A0ACC1PPG0_9APHY|nr:hypothetical protein NUW54_g7311 [Trametes sanguinea]